MKGGDVSLILRNVSSDDGGVYECRVSEGDARRVKRANIKTDPVTVISLEVEESSELEACLSGLRHQELVY